MEHTELIQKLFFRELEAKPLQDAYNTPEMKRIVYDAVFKHVQNECDLALDDFGQLIPTVKGDTSLHLYRDNKRMQLSDLIAQHENKYFQSAEDLEKKSDPNSDLEGIPANLRNMHYMKRGIWS